MSEPSTMNRPCFSVVTISFNAGDALRRTIESVNTQTYPLIEHILIDGGSTDGSVALIQRLARRDARWVSEPDHGIADAFNKGTSRARGDYICYLNAGDVFAAHDVLTRVARQMSLAPGGAPVVYYGDFNSIDQGVERHHVASAALEDFAWDNPINHQSAFVPRQLALEFPYDRRLILGMDHDFWLRVIAVAEFRKVPFPIAVFEAGGRSNTPAWEMHSLIIHRVLWHINRGSRLEAKDWVILAGRALRLKANVAVRWVLGKRLSLTLRATKSRWRHRSRQPSPHLA